MDQGQTQQTGTQTSSSGGTGTSVTNGFTAPTPSSYVINLQGMPVTSGGSTVTQDDGTTSLMAKFTIPDEMKTKYPELLKLVLLSESMTDDERQYWFQILPIMTEEQVKKFKDILDTEKKQLDTLDKEYEEQLNKLNQRHDIEWKEFESKEKRREIEKREEQTKSEDQAAQESLLSQLNNL